MLAAGTVRIRLPCIRTTESSTTNAFSFLWRLKGKLPPTYFSEYVPAVFAVAHEIMTWNSENIQNESFIDLSASQALDHLRERGPREHLCRYVLSFQHLRGGLNERPRHPVLPQFHRCRRCRTAARSSLLCVFLHVFAPPRQIEFLPEAQPR